MVFSGSGQEKQAVKYSDSDHTSLVQGVPEGPPQSDVMEGRVFPPPLQAQMAEFCEVESIIQIV